MNNNARQADAAVTANFPPSGWRLLARFMVGLIWLAMMAMPISEVSQYPYPLVLLIVVTIAGFLSALGLTWITLWARRADSRLGQFQIASLFFLTVFGAIFFSVVRWLVVQIWSQAGARIDGVEPYLQVAGVCIIVGILSTPFVLGMTEAVLWFGVSLIKQPVMRRWLVNRRRASDLTQERSCDAGPDGDA